MGLDEMNKRIMPRPLRILTISPTYFPLEGGAERHLMFMTKAQAKSGKKVTLLTQREPNTPRRCIEAEVEVIRTGRIGSRTFSPLLCHISGAITMLVKLLSIARNYDVIHAHFTHYSLAIGLIGRLLNRTCKVVVTAHGSDLHVWARKSPTRQITRWMLAKADHIIAVSKELLGIIRNDLGIDAEKTTYIPNGVDTTFFYPPNHTEHEWDLLFFSGRKPHKGLEYLIRAMVILKERGQMPRLGLTSESPYIIECSRLSKDLGLSENVSFLGEISLSKLREQIWNSSIVVIPSLYEGLPCSLLEAMSCAKPVVATRVGGMPDVIEDAHSGIIVESRNPEALAEAISMLYGDEKMQVEMGSNARKYVEANCDWTQIERKVSEVYSVVLSSRPECS